MDGGHDRIDGVTSKERYMKLSRATETKEGYWLQVGIHEKR